MKKIRLPGKVSLKQPWMKWVVLGVIAYLTLLVVMVPANRVYGVIQPMLKERNVPVDLYGLNGSLWDGSAQVATISGKPLRNIHWDLNPTEIVLGRLSANLDFADRKSSGELKLTRSFLGTVRVNNIQMNIDVNELLSLLKVPFVKLDGALQIDIDQIVLADKQITNAEGAITWKDAGTRVPQKQKLGDLIATVETTEKGIRATLKDAGGPLELNGEFVLAQNGAYTFNGQMLAREGVNSNLGRSLLMFGRMMPDNKVVVSTQGNLADFGLM